MSDRMREEVHLTELAVGRKILIQSVMRPVGTRGAARRVQVSQ